jgi:hypothetical protein
MSDDVKQGNRPEPQTPEEALKQAKDDSLSPDEKHKHYLEDIERLHNESQSG